MKYGAKNRSIQGRYLTITMYTHTRTHAPTHPATHPHTHIDRIGAKVSRTVPDYTVSFF